MKLNLKQIGEWTGGKFAGSYLPDEIATGYSIDSRTVQPGDIFFAVQGERFDGHDFVAAALKRGAIAAVIASTPANRYSQADISDRLLQVDEPLAAMQRLANAVRRHWGRRVIGVTGSAGKTTTKEAITTVLESRFCVHKSQGNLNNHYGLPLQLLKLLPEHEVAVLEMGMSHAGEIAALCDIAAPDWAVITNVGTAHGENFSDGQEGIARAKYELVASLPNDGTAILNFDDPLVRQFGKSFAGKAIFYGIGMGADPRAESIVPLGVAGTKFMVVSSGQGVETHFPLLGEHNVRNALAGIATGLASGIPLEVCTNALRNMAAPDKRGQTLQVQGATVLNDCYNSNPQALLAMVDALLTVPACRTIIVAGEMLELGASSAQLHYECGEYMGKCGVNIVLGVRGEAASIVAGATSAGAAGIFVATPEDAGLWLRENLKTGDAVLLKASRGVQLERALDILLPASPR